MACPDCARRGLLLRQLVAHIDRAVERGAGSRARDLLALGDQELAAAVGGAAADRALEVSFAQASGSALADRLERHGCWAICRHEPGWPPGFARLGEAAPRALFGRGRRALVDEAGAERTATLVGSRRASPYGREVARTLGFELAAAGVVVVSGMAYGVDGCAHRGALDAGGGTVAVLGAGPERAYPRRARGLYGAICESGVAISELPPSTPTFRWIFPARNRLMAALGGITVVVEAAERSGSLITAEMAVECGRPVGAVPGPVGSWRSAGCNRLLFDGAAVVRDGGDVLDHLLGPGFVCRPAPEPALDPLARAVLDAVEAGAGTIDAIAEVSGLAPSEAAAALSVLERAGAVVTAADGSYSRGLVSDGGPAGSG